LSIATGTVVEQLKSEYAGQPVVFIEDNVDTPVGGRKSYWWAANGAGSAYLPLTMVDSGHAFTSGYSSSTTYTTYKGMLDASLARPAQAQFTGLNSTRVGNHINFNGSVTNLLPTTLPASARVHILVYEEHTAIAGEHITRHILRAHVSLAIGSDLATSASKSFALETAELSNIVDWNKVHAVVLVDYRPGGTTGAYDMLQAAPIYPLVNYNIHFYLPLLYK
jgi:hypothetical protein